MFMVVILYSSSLRKGRLMGITVASRGHYEVKSLGLKDGHLSLWVAVMMVPCSRKLEAIRGRMDEHPQEDALVKGAQWRSAAVRLHNWPPPHDDSTSWVGMIEPCDMWRPEAWFAAVHKCELCRS